MDVIKIIAQQCHAGGVLRTTRERRSMMVDMRIRYKAEQLIRVDWLIDNGGGD